MLFFQLLDFILFLLLEGLHITSAETLHMSQKKDRNFYSEAIQLVCGGDDSKYRPSFRPLSHSWDTPWILKRSGLETFGRRLIYLNIQTKRNVWGLCDFFNFFQIFFSPDFFGRIVSDCFFLQLCYQHVRVPKCCGHVTAKIFLALCNIQQTRAKPGVALQTPS